MAMMTATELFKSSSDALAITGPAEWDSPDAPGQRDAFFYVDEEAAYQTRADYGVSILMSSPSTCTL